MTTPHPLPPRIDRDAAVAFLDKVELYAHALMEDPESTAVDMTEIVGVLVAHQSVMAQLVRELLLAYDD